MEQKTKSKGLVARILGEQPTTVQKNFVRLMLLTLLLWPIGFFVSIFFFWDASIQSSIDEICRWGATLTIWLYPIYLIPLIRLWFKFSKKLGRTWLFFFCPFVPVVVICLFLAFTSSLSEISERKPEYDPLTYKCLNKTYALDVNHAYYWDEILEGANPSTFKVLGHHYATDLHHVWYNDIIIEGADPATFVVPYGDISDLAHFALSHLAHDAHDYYMGDRPLHVANMGSFRLIDDNWALDSLQVYYIGIYESEEKKAVPVGDYRTFKALNTFYAVDAKCVYYKNNIVEGADPASFAVLKGEYHYAKDKNRVYCEAYGSSIRDLNTLKHKNMEQAGLGNAFHTDCTTVYNPKLMTMPEGTDFATIHRVEGYWFADSKHVYYENRLLPGANPTTFVIFPSHYVQEDRYFVSGDFSCIDYSDSDYSHDGNHVYYRDSLMPDADIASFICGYDCVAGQSFAFDKNRYYQGTPNPRIEKLRQGKFIISRLREFIIRTLDTLPLR